MDDSIMAVGGTPRPLGAPDPADNGPTALTLALGTADRARSKVAELTRQLKLAEREARRSEAIAQRERVRVQLESHRAAITVLEDRAARITIDNPKGDA